MLNFGLEVQPSQRAADSFGVMKLTIALYG